MSATVPRRPPGDLTGSQRRHLRGLAHHLEPVVQIGKEGLSEAIARQVDEALEHHELIKVRILESAPASRREVLRPLADAVGAHVAGEIGRIGILYRRHASRPTIVLP